MDIRIKPDFSFADDRGKLVQLAHKGYEQMNVLISYQGVHRGGHYHKQSNESFYVISGSVEVTIHELDGSNEQVFLFQADDYFRIGQKKVHHMYFPQDCVMVGMYDQWIEKGDGEKDIYPYPDPGVR